MLCALLAGGSVSLGQAPNWVGTKVVTKYQAPIHVAGQVVDKDNLIEILHIFEVERVDGDRLWLKAGKISGWPLASDVIPFDKAIDFYTDEIKAKPGAADAYMNRGFI
jgi:hypothetical protein